MITILTVIVIIGCLAASLLHFTAIRSPDTSDLDILKAARRITGIAFLIAAMYLGYSLYEAGWAHVPMTLVLGIAALGQILFAMHTFLEPSCTARLMATHRKPNETSHA